MKLIELIRDTMAVFYPRLCAACDDLLVKHEQVICMSCVSGLPRTNYHLDPANPVAKQFWGKVLIEGATAYYHFIKGERVQVLMHRLKYRSQPEIGVQIGKYCGAEIQSSTMFSGCDIVIPVPLHPAKLRLRGYNQASVFAEGLSLGMNIGWNDDILVRTRKTDTQTRKNRFARYKNVEEVFRIDKPELIRNKKILLVDDVITTGSTLSACANAILEVQGTRVCVCSIAYAVS